MANDTIKILIVDDDPRNLDALDVMLEPVGCTLRMNKSLTYPGWVNLRVAQIRDSEGDLAGFAISASHFESWSALRNFSSFSRPALRFFATY